MHTLYKLFFALGALALSGVLHEASKGAKIAHFFGYGMGLSVVAAFLSLCSSVFVCFYDNYPDIQLYDKNEVAAVSIFSDLTIFKKSSQ